MLDFGIADDERMGTPAYLPPEHDLSPSADVYALGIVWFEAVRAPAPGAGGDPRRAAGTLRRDLRGGRPTAAEIATALGVAPGDAEEVAGGEQAAAYEAAEAYRAITLRQPPRTRTRTLACSPSAHGRLLLVAGGTTAAAVAALGLLLSGAAFRPVAAPVDSVLLALLVARLAGRLAGAPGHRLLGPVTAPGPAALGTRPSPRPAGTAPRVLAATPPTALEALSRMRRSVDQGLAASEVRVDVAVDLDNVIGNLQAQLANGTQVDVNQRVSELRTKIAQRVREGGLAQNRADDLTQALSAV